MFCIIEQKVLTVMFEKKRKLTYHVIKDYFFWWGETKRTISKYIHLKIFLKRGHILLSIVERKIHS